MLQILLFYTVALPALLRLSASADLARNEDGLNALEERITTDNDDQYLPDFPTLSRSIIGRAGTPNTETLSNNIPASTNTIQPGNRQFYVFPLTALHGAKSNLTPIIPGLDRREEQGHYDLRRRANDVTYYLSLSVCSQPTSSTKSGPPADLVVLVSYQNPLPDGTQPNAKALDMEQGFTSFADPTSDEIHISITAPETNGYTGLYTFELTVSIDDFYSFYDPTQNWTFIDSDNQAATFVSGILANYSNNDTLSAWNKSGPLYTAVVANQADLRFTGLAHSPCALRNTTVLGSPATNQSGVQVETDLKNFTGPGQLLQQFYMSGLQAGTNYYASMLLPSKYGSTGSGKPGGGGIISNEVTFTTKSVGNCRIIYNMPSCPQVNYAVPFNPNTVSGPNLTNWYDQQYATSILNFFNALDQVACDTPSESKYSLAVGCNECKQAYSDWLCATLNPRCEDITAQQSYFHARAISQNFPQGTSGPSQSDILSNQTLQNLLAYNSSRNPAIDTTIIPGPYKELLPCGNLCYHVVRACPAIMGFACPSNAQDFNNSYGYALMDGSNPQCNDPKAVYGVGLGSGSNVQPSLALLFGFAILSIAIG